ncbi:MAG TPA: OmpH family outer membrane protein [Alphaproteobacteria bacterium]|nr:OmpH family outer membrane protein [Alphaproteobacteria bacterium]
MFHSLRRDRPGLLALVLLLALALAPVARSAESAKDAAAGNDNAPVIAVLDVQKVLRESKAAQDVQQAVEQRRQTFEKKINDERDKLKAEEDKLRKQQTVLSPKAFDKRRRELERRYADLRRDADRTSSRLNDAVNAAMHTLRKEVAKIVADIMNEQNINITLARTAVLVFDERLNVTDQVLARLNEKLPKLDVDFDAPAPAQKPDSN